MDIHFEVDGILASLEMAGTFIQPITLDEEIRGYLAENLGPGWRKAALLRNDLYGQTVYTATLVLVIDDHHIPIVYVLDRDKHGRWYIATTSPVSGYIE